MAVARAKPASSNAGVRSPMHRTLAELLESWDAYAEPIPVEALRAGLRQLRISRRDIARFAVFSPDCYQRNRIHAGRAYEILALCWASGQRSPIHDHRGSACAVRVVEGVATETRFEFSPSGLVYATETNRWGEGAVTASVDSDMHQMGNLEPAGKDLVTLHVYSPPLLRMGRYYLGDAVMGEGDVALRSGLLRNAAGRRPARMKAAVTAIRARARRSQG